MYDVCTTGDTAHIDTIFTFFSGQWATTWFLLAQTPSFSKCLYHARTVFSVGGSFTYFARNARCTVTTDLLVWYSNTQNDFSPGAAIFSLHTPVWPSGRNVNYDKKNYLLGKKFWSCSFCSFYLYRFCKYVSRDFPIIIFFLIPGYIMKRPVYLSALVRH